MCPNHQHSKKDVRRYHKGANRDIDPELLGDTDGIYLDARNMRPTPSDGDAGSIDKIFGEDLIHPNKAPFCIVGNSDPLPGSYLCTGAVEINDHIVEFWADDDNIEDSIIRIDGDVVLQSSDFPITTADLLQIAKNESCVGGEVYITDYKVTPMFFNIQDLIDNKCEQKFFNDFDLAKNQIILKLPADHPVFIELIDGGGSGSNLVSGGRVEFGGGGNANTVGTYQYRIRYVSDDGERTRMSIATPPIPVPSRISSLSTQYPNVMTHGDVAGTVGFRVKIRFRITNLRDFDFIEVIRSAYNTEAGISVISTTDVIARIEVDPQEISIIDFIDDDTVSLEVITEQEETDVMKTIARAKAIRYFNQRLFLMNVEFESREVNGVQFKTALNNEALYPTIEKIDKIGHRDPFNHTYFKKYMNGERYGFAAVFLDGSGERSFAIPVTGGENFQMPNRRDIASQNTLNSISNGDGFQQSVRAATVDGTVDFTHEVFDLKEAVAKTDVCSFINISKSGRKLNSKINEFCPTNASSNKATDIGFKPFTPTNQDDTVVTGHGIVVNVAVDTGVNGFQDINDGYKPVGFAPRYFAMGMAIEGITNIPSWVESITIVRTDPAGRVVTQGLGFYNIKEGDLTFFDSIPAGKETNSFWFHAPDIENGFVSQSAIQNNLAAHSVQLVSPLGMFTEIYSGRNDTVLDFHGGNRDTHVDMISYVRILEEPGGTKAINFGDSNTEVGFDSTFGIGINGFVSYGKWRNKPSKVSPIFDPVSVGMGNNLLDITSFTTKTDGIRGSSFFELTVAQSVYVQSQIGGFNQKQFSDGGLKDYHEPMYIVNIVREDINVPNQNITEYFETGHFQKLDAIIGKSDGTNDQEYFLVDERFEDCIPEPNDPNRASIDKNLFIESPDGSLLRFLNVTFKSVAQLATIVSDITTNGFFVDANGNNIVGIYKNQDVLSNRRLFKITIDNQDLGSNAPVADSLIRVKYDNTEPLKVFGGDTTISEALFAPIDRQGQDGGGSESKLSNNSPFFTLNLGFPYYKYEINPRYYQIRNKPILVGGVDIEPNRIQDTGKTDLDFIRQMIAMYTVESRGDLSFLFHDRDTVDESFALKNYVVRPLEWRTSKDLDKNRIFDAYGSAYPDTIVDLGTSDELPSGEWRFGGFKFLPLINSDYSHKALAQQHFSKPKVGFVEENLFCTRIIWSEKRGVNVQDSPGIRTFRSENKFDISDNQGEIKFGWDAIDPSKGSNLYAICDSGICLLITDKRILSDKNATELAIIGTDESNVVLEQLWITKDVGMHDEMWRSAAEFDSSLYFANHNSVYALQNSAWRDIGREGYHVILRENMLDGIADGFEDSITGVYDRLHNEYWITFRRKSREKAIVFAGLINLVDPGNIVGSQEVSKEILEDDIIKLTGSFEDIESPPVVFLASFNPTYALTAREFTLCATEDSSPIDIQFPSSLGVQTLLTLQPDQCACITATADIFDGEFRGGQGGIESIVFPQGTDLSNFSPGETIILSYFDRKTGLNVSNPFVIFTVTADTINIDAINADLQDSLNDTDPIQVVSSDVKWEFEICDIPINAETFVYNVVNKSWNGRYDYAFDRYLSIKNRTFGMRELSTFEVNKGFEINGADITGFVTHVSAKDQMDGKEFIRFRAASDNKPTRVEFLDAPEGAVLAALDPGIQGPLYLKDYRGFEQYIPRKQDSTRQRIQDRLLIFKVIHDKPEHFKMVSTMINYKVLK